MDVINLSLGETEIDPRATPSSKALNAAADAGVVAAVSAGNDFDSYGNGTIDSPANAAKAISVAASSGGHGSPDVDSIASFSSAGPAPYSLMFKPDVTAPGEDVAPPRPAAATSSSAERACRHRTSRERRPCCASGIRPGRRRMSGRHWR